MIYLICLVCLVLLFCFLWLGYLIDLACSIKEEINRNKKIYAIYRVYGCINEKNIFLGFYKSKREAKKIKKTANEEFKIETVIIEKIDFKNKISKRIGE